METKLAFKKREGKNERKKKQPEAKQRKHIIISQLTEGSRNAVKPVSPLIKAKTKEIIAAAINIFTSKSSNCFKTNFQNGAPAHVNFSGLRTFISKHV